MKTLTIFNAYANSQRALNELCAVIAGSAHGMPAGELAALIVQTRRCARQCDTFEGAIRARLSKSDSPIDAGVLFPR